MQCRKKELEGHFFVCEEDWNKNESGNDDENKLHQTCLNDISSFRATQNINKKNTIEPSHFLTPKYFIFHSIEFSLCKTELLLRV
jgi:hypothetical protein